MVGLRTVHLLARSGFLHVPVAGWSGSDEARRDGGIMPRLNDGEDVEMTFHDTSEMTTTLLLIECAFSRPMLSVGGR